MGHSRPSLSSSNFASSGTLEEGIQTQTSAGIGLSSSNLFQRRRRMLDSLNRLRGRGVQVDIDLPQVAVIGSQSSGKSSLMESISGITLPRFAGTCTRCPIECSLSGSDTPWQCIVSVLLFSDAQGQLSGQRHDFGQPISDKTKVEERIRRAQKAVLNPERLYDFLTSKDFEEDDSSSEPGFSVNRIILGISGPNVEDLSFVDLPGLIASVSSKSKEGDIALVEALVSSYIQKENCIILLTVACETDFENQRAPQFAKMHDSGGKRTIGVLTKPDRIPEGDEKSWISIIRKEKEQLVNGWFCVKQPDSVELKSKMNWDQAGENERNFFKTKVPWSELNDCDRNCLGAKNLVDKLSSILTDMILESRPKILDQITQKIASIRRKLAALPPSREPKDAICTLLHEFILGIKQLIDGEAHYAGFHQSIRSAQDRFKSTIWSTAPKFSPFEKEPRCDESDTESQLEPPVSQIRSQWSRPVSGATGLPKKRKSREGDEIYIDDVSKTANEARSRELPGHTPFPALKIYIDAFVARWSEPSFELCNASYSILTEKVNTLVIQCFRQGRLADRIHDIMEQRLRERKEKADLEISKVLDRENWPFTLNPDFPAYKSAFLRRYRRQRNQYANAELTAALEHYCEQDSCSNPEVLYDSELSPVAMFAAITEGCEGLGPASQDSTNLQQDKMEPSLMIMAEVQAYFQVGHKAFIDNIARTIDQALTRGLLEGGLLESLLKGTRINSAKGDELCNMFAPEILQNSNKRIELQEELERLEVAQQELLDVGL